MESGKGEEACFWAWQRYSLAGRAFLGWQQPSSLIWPPFVVIQLGLLKRLTALGTALNSNHGVLLFKAGYDNSLPRRDINSRRQHGCELLNFKVRELI
jgi:hypothetical protein